MASSEKRIYHFDAKIEDCEIRKVEEYKNTFKSKDGKDIEYSYILLSVDVGEDCERIYLKDKDMANLKVYKRGMMGDFIIRIDVEEDFGSKCKFLIKDFKERE